MAINVNQVYKAVLVVLQQEKRGVLTPTEFNKIATQAQQEIFTEYFDELNQLLRQPQTSLAPLTAPTAFYTVYTYEDNVIELYPTLTGSVTLNFLKFPADVKWGFTIDTELGNYIYSEQASTDFEIHKSDQPLLVDKILGYRY
mgnify:CR=1 FL=1